MSSEMLKTLKKSIKDELVVSIFTDRYQPEKCSVGIVEGLSNEYILMKHISPNGLYDGYIIRKLENLFRVDIGGQYEQRLKLLYSLQKQVHHNILSQRKKELDIIREALGSAQKLKLVVSICIDDTETAANITGWVKEINDTEIEISKITFEGLDDGISIVNINDIIKINCDTNEEISMKLLNLNR